MRLSRNPHVVALAVLVGVAGMAYPLPCRATTYNVTTTAELVAAIAAANASPGPDIINCAAGLYTPGTITITDDLTLNGGGRPGTVIDGLRALVSGFYVNPPSLHVNFNNLTIAHYFDGIDSAIGPTGLVTISGCTIAGNWVDGIQVGGGPTEILNSTFSGNWVGVYANDETAYGDPVNLDNDTIVDNGDLGLSTFNAVVTVRNTIIANNTYGNCNVKVTAGYPGGPAGFADHDIDSDGSGGPGFTTTLPMLGPLADNGGPTQSYELLLGSPAIDAGSNCVATDQRGVVRPQGSGCDIGAFERTTFPFTSVSANVPPGGSITTDTGSSGATPSNPVQTTMAAPGGGSITIEQGPGVDFGFLGQSVQITAVPDATPANPFVIVFTIDASVIPSGQSAATIVVTKNGVVVPDCTGAPGAASPDPCITSRQTVAGGDAQITVLSSTASHWAFKAQAPLAVEGRPARLEFSVFPNPVREGATVQLSLPTAANVDLSVFDLSGRKVATLAAGTRPAGQYSIAWHDAARLRAGLYFLRLRAGAEVRTQSVLRVK